MASLRSLSTGKTTSPTIFISFLIIAALYFYPAIDGSNLLTERDLSVFFIPPRILWTEALKRGEFPLWNPFFYSGHPLLATLQPGIFYPFNLLLLILPFDMAFNWIIIVHFALAGTFTYMLLCELNASKPGAIAGALIFMLSGYLFSTHNVLNTLLAVAWSPLTVYLSLKAVKRGSYGYAAATGVVLAVMFFAGGIEVFYATCAVLFALSVMPQILIMRPDEAETQPNGVILSGMKKRLALFAISISMFFSISAVQLLPFLELARASTRSAGLTYAEATTWSFDIKDFIQFVLPDPFGYASSDDKYWTNQSWLKTVYVGSIPLLLSVFFFVENKKKTLPFILSSILGLTVAMGKNNLSYQALFYYLPLFNKFRYPVKFLFIPFLFLSISAGLGFDSFLRLSESKKNLVYKITIAFLVLSTVSAIALGLLVWFDVSVTSYLVKNGIDYPAYNFASINVFNAKRGLFFLTVAATLVYAAHTSDGIKRLFPLAACLLLFVDLFFAHNGFYFMTKASDYHEKSSVMKLIEKDTSIYRVYVTPKTMRGQISVVNAKGTGAPLRGIALEKERMKGFNLEHGIFDIDGLEVMLRGDYSALMAVLSYQEAPDSTNILSMLNVKYLISTPTVKSTEFRLLGAAGEESNGVIERDGVLKVYENRKFLPRFFAVKDWQIMNDDAECIRTLLKKSFNPAKTALLYKEPAAAAGKLEKSANAEKSSPWSVEVIEYKNNAIRLKARLPWPGLLVASESYYPGWKVYVDGMEEEILKADYVLRAVPLKAGAHTVEFVYRPASFYAGGVISLIGVTGLFAFAFIGRKYGKRNPKND
ncbi:MAG: YfhO family protein [Deltaproteobacteria bacterium]|nr:YfhO family protein [Deltaproteobacteria bacterium]